MAVCRGCGGIIGQSCFNPPECEWIAADMARQRDDPPAQEVTLSHEQIIGGIRFERGTYEIRRVSPRDDEHPF